MLFSYYACPECETRIGLKSDWKKIHELEHYKNIMKPINVKIFRCPVCNKVKWFDYVGYAEVHR